MCSEALRDSNYFLISHMDWYVSLISEAINLTIVVQEEGLVFFSEWSIVCCITCFCVHEVVQCDLCAGFVCIFCSSPRRSTCWSRPRRSSGRSWRRSSNSVAVTWGATAGTMAIFHERCVCGSRFAVVQCSLSHAARILTKRNRVWSTLQPILDP